ncbi:MAG: TlpA family protein disulfide reductase [Chlorobi bacterium]|nr:TlpA family protein disulfide reductase [Chlorobiota bacterium]
MLSSIKTLKPFLIIITVFILASCGSQGQEESKLVSKAWMEFKVAADRYDSLQAAIRKLESEDPELQNNPALLSARLKDNMADIRAIYQAIPAKAKPALSDVQDVDHYTYGDLHYLKLAAISTGKNDLALDINKRLLTFDLPADSTLDIKLETAQLLAMKGDVKEAESYLDDEVVKSAGIVEQSQLFSNLSRGYTANGDLDKAREYAIKAAKALKTYQAQSDEVVNKQPDEKQRLQQRIMQYRYFANQYSQLASSLVAELNAAGRKDDGSAFLKTMQSIIGNDTLWNQTESIIKNDVAQKEKELSSLNKPAPEFDEHEWIGSEPLSLKKLRGRVVLIDFFATWCKPCIIAFPHIREWNEKYASKGLTIIGLTSYQGRYDRNKVTPEQELAKLKDDFIPKHKITWPVGVEKYGQKTFKAYGVVGIPHVVLIDKKGNIRYTKTGAADYTKTEQMIKKLLAE